MRARAAALRAEKKDRFFHNVCDRLHVAPAALARVPFDRVMAAVKALTNGKPVAEAMVKAEVARFAADHAEPEAPSPLKPVQPR